MYELIQNADDNSYTDARRSDEQPWLAFTLTNEHLIVDTNEDGFTVANVSALCSISESSKNLHAGDESIGEKGIGFKSVFAIAHEVHIQSRHWSFLFQGIEEDPLSIIIPKAVPHQEIPAGVKTRIKLRYDTGIAERLASDLERLSHNVLMFLQKIQRLTISVESVLEEDPPQRIFVKRDKSPNHSASLNTRGWSDQPDNWGTRDDEGDGLDNGDESDAGQTIMLETYTGCSVRTIKARNRYHLHRCSFGMPPHRRRHGTTAEVQLAFPVAENSLQPRLSSSGEEIFAFLPMRPQRGIPVSLRHFSSLHFAD